MTTDPMLDEVPKDPEAAARFRRNLVRVITIQVIALLLLALIQRHYTA